MDVVVLPDLVAELLDAGTALPPALAVEMASLRRSNEDLRELASAVSHDLQQPLVALNRWARIVSEELGTAAGDEERHHLELLVDSAQRLQAMVDGMLECARVDSKGAAFTVVDLDEVLDEALIHLGPLMELRTLGVKLSVDDFGTGYSSLTYLQRFRYDALKIDRSFVSDLGRSSDGAKIVQTIVGLAALLGMDVIAEGIETDFQADWLRKMHCPQGQGFLFAHPLGVTDVEGLLRDEG